MDTEDFIDSTIANLKIMGMLQKNDKIRVHKGQISIDRSENAMVPFSQALRRWINRDSRDVTLIHLRNTVGNAIRVARALAASSSAAASSGLSLSPGGSSPMMATMKPSGEMRGWTLQRLIEEMHAAEMGLQNLRATYNEDSSFMAAIDVLMDRLRMNSEDVVQTTPGFGLLRMKPSSSKPAAAAQGSFNDNNNSNSNTNNHHNIHASGNSNSPSNSQNTPNTPNTQNNRPTNSSSSSYRAGGGEQLTTQYVGNVDNDNNNNIADVPQGHRGLHAESVDDESLLCASVLCVSASEAEGTSSSSYPSSSAVPAAALTHAANEPYPSKDGKQQQQNQQNQQPAQSSPQAHQQPQTQQPQTQAQAPSSGKAQNQSINLPARPNERRASNSRT